MTAPRVSPDLMGASPVMRTFDEFSRATVRRQLRGAVDPRIVEIVRLRCARYHDCRLCASVRVLDAELDDPMAAKIDRYESSDLPDAWKAALRLADAVIMMPGAVGEDLRADVRRHFDDDQISQLLFSIMKWSCQKALVSLRVDIPQEEGTPVTYDRDGHRIIGTAAIRAFQQAG
ncbi:carboxymuconolactone decarboxylase family protein [Prauserella muralis]|nr:hypothetical protein [Prauserella muralis]TWE27616.1 hypothetical protein FHX69_0253 [Prauserella muralis]